MIQCESPAHWVGDCGSKLAIVESIESWPDSFNLPSIEVSRSKTTKQRSRICRERCFVVFNLLTSMDERLNKSDQDSMDSAIASLEP